MIVACIGLGIGLDCFVFMDKRNEIHVTMLFQSSFGVLCCENPIDFIDFPLDFRACSINPWTVFRY